MTTDVVVIGGGPAGLALGIALRRLGRSAVVLERTTYDAPRVGETFSGDLAPLLQQLGVWEAFQALGSMPFRGVQSAWGAEILEERASIFHPFGDGWHVNRAQFDRLLASSAAQAGVVVEQGFVARTSSSSGGDWCVRSATGAEIRARYLVDASGRGAPATAARFPERAWQRVDRLVALVGCLRAPQAPLEPVLLLESVEEGWWYSVPQPDGTLLATLMTDADLLPVRRQPALAEQYLKALRRAKSTGARAEGATLSAPPRLARSDSGLLSSHRGERWRAIGDAAMACDPLAGDGVVRALRAALEAAPEIDRELAGDGAGTGAAPAPLLERFRDYLEKRGRYYAAEPRWPQSLFWARRRAIDWTTAPIFLDPRRMVRSSGPSPVREAAARAEALLPLHSVYALLQRLQTPAPAHEAMALLRSTSRLDDRRLLVGLQELIRQGCVTAEG